MSFITKLDSLVLTLFFVQKTFILLPFNLICVLIALYSELMLSDTTLEFDCSNVANRIR